MAKQQMLCEVRKVIFDLVAPGGQAFEGVRRMRYDLVAVPTDRGNCRVAAELMCRNGKSLSWLKDVGLGETKRPKLDEVLRRLARNTISMDSKRDCYRVLLLVGDENYAQQGASYVLEIGEPVEVISRLASSPAPAI